MKRTTVLGISPHKQGRKHCLCSFLKTISKQNNKGQTNPTDVPLLLLTRVFLCHHAGDRWHYAWETSVSQCFPFSWTGYFRISLREFLQLWHKRGFGREDEDLWSNVKVTMTSRNMFLGHNSRAHDQHFNDLEYNYKVMQSDIPKVKGQLLSGPCYTAGSRWEYYTDIKLHCLV